MVYIYSAHRVPSLDGFYITPSNTDIDNIKEDATVVYTYDEELAEAYRERGVIVNVIDPNTND
jgi:ribulose-5-phosphate 4-epimerase/fuculose-1-phosphate aldolase